MTRRAIAAGALLLIVGALGLAACDPEKMKAWELAGQPGLGFRIKQFYEARGIEENGRCRDPIMQGINSSRIVSEDDQQLVVEVTYFYTDYVRGDDDCDEGRPLRCGMLRECRGFNARTFTVEKRADGAAVVEMSGEQSRRPFPSSQSSQ